MTYLGVVIPACNERAYIADTLRSLAAQSPGPAKAFEVVVVENNSTDDTGEVVEAVARQSPVPVTLLRGGTVSVTAARVLGINYLLERQPPARYLISADADTYYPPGWLAAVATQLAAGADLVTTAGYMDPEFWRRCPNLTRCYVEEIGSLFFDPDTKAGVVGRDRRCLFTEQIHHDFGRPMCEAGFAIRADCYQELGGFRPDLAELDDDQPLLHERFPLMFGAALAGYRVTQLSRPWWSTSPRRLVGEPAIQFGPEFAQTKLRQHRDIADEAYVALDQRAAGIDFRHLRFNCVLDYIVMPCITRPTLVRRHRHYFGDDWRLILSTVYGWLAEHLDPEPRMLVNFALELAGQHADLIIERLRAGPWE